MTKLELCYIIQIYRTEFTLNIIYGSINIYTNHHIQKHNKFPLEVNFKLNVHLMDLKKIFVLEAVILIVTKKEKYIENTLTNLKWVEFLNGN